MTIRNKKSSPKTQGNLFDWIRQAASLSNNTLSPPDGSLNIDAEIRAAISEDLKHAKEPNSRELSRYDVAARMSELTGDDITKSMLDNWSAEAHKKHRFPCQFLPAFRISTGGRQTFDVLSRRSGLFALPGKEAIRVEIQKIDEAQKKNKKEKMKWTLFLKEIDGGS
ncbi:MAG TPA: hypothetical protein ENG95_07390 [Nitrospirae bacterium]|nr:hypothetical protein [Nitrospirota bacterium]HDK16573.1 hypothetical protein [Nitrospirota bacterium]HDK81041.1 hypothetical protein [Nitrospirota bacterium]HDO26450.1 hypothetical protein [Nitrospirota bacterium]